MRTRAAAIACLVFSLTLGAVAPARAQEPFFEVALGRGAFAVWENPRAQVFAFAFAGQGVFYNSDLDEPLVGDLGCAGIGNDKKGVGVFGCGQLSEFSIDDDLGAAMGKGSFDATIFNFETGESKPGGKVSFEAVWKASGDPAPRYDQGSHVEPSFVGVFVDLDVLARDASDGAKGKVTARPIGPGPTHVVEAGTFVGPHLVLELHG